MYNLKEDHDLQAKFASLARKAEVLEFRNSGQLKSIQDIVCQICEMNEHSTHDCPTLSSFKECLHEQANALNSSKSQIITHTRKRTTLVGEIIQILVRRVVTIMHKLHNHYFKPTIIFKIL